MGKRNFRSAVLTLSDANEAGYYVFVKCERCETKKEIHPYKLLSRHKRLINAPLDTLLDKLYCRTRGCHVQASITCNYRRSGEI